MIFSFFEEKVILESLNAQITSLELLEHQFCV